jgi:hypothetical protein
LLEDVEEDSHHFWQDGEEGHLQTIVDYIENESIHVEKQCKMCTEIEAHVPVMVDHDSPDVVDSEEIREDRAVGKRIACETYLLNSDVLIFEVFDGRIPIDHKFFYPEELKTRGKLVLSRQIIQANTSRAESITIDQSPASI